MSGKMRNCLQMAPQLTFKMQQEWDDRWIGRWPMASTKLIEQGKVNDEIYDREEGNFQRRVRLHTIRALNYIAGVRELFGGEYILHAGVGEDLRGYLKQARSFGLKIVGCDISKVRCRKVVNLKAVEVRMLDVMDCIKQELGWFCVMLHASRIFHHLEPDEQREAFWNIGAFLGNRNNVFVCVYPFADNDNFRGATAHPVERDEFFRHVSQHAGGPIEIINEEQWYYFDVELYTALTLAVL